MVRRGTGVRGCLRERPALAVVAEGYPCSLKGSKRWPIPNAKALLLWERAWTWAMPASDNPLSGTARDHLLKPWSP
jgi:hypothetical protein